MPLYLFDNVFLLYFALEATKRILQRFAFLQSYFCQTKNTPKLTRLDCVVISTFLP